jgi:hypothetical protein
MRVRVNLEQTQRAGSVLPVWQHGIRFVQLGPGFELLRLRFVQPGPEFEQLRLRFVQSWPKSRNFAKIRAIRAEIAQLFRRSCNPGQSSSSSGPGSRNFYGNRATQAEVAQLFRNSCSSGSGSSNFYGIRATQAEVAQLFPEFAQPGPVFVRLTRAARIFEFMHESWAGLREFLNSCTSLGPGCASF